MLKILLMQTKLRSHSIEYFCFYLNNQIIAIRGSRDSTSSVSPGYVAHSMLFCAPAPAPENEGKL